MKSKTPRSTQIPDSTRFPIPLITPTALPFPVRLVDNPTDAIRNNILLCPRPGLRVEVAIELGRVPAAQVV